MTAIQTRGLVAVGVDGSPEATTAARYAVTLAQARHVDLLVVHAYQLPMAVPTAAELTAARVVADQVAGSVVAELRLSPTMRVGTVVEMTTPAALLCRVAETAAVVVIGVHHFDLSDQLLTGPVASAVAAEADCPVVVVPRQWRPTGMRPGSIVAALDGETAATAVLDFTFDEAERSQSGVTALHAVPRSANESGADRLSISEILAGHEQAHPDIVVRTLVLAGEPTSVIIGESLAATMAVVGRPHRRRLGSWTRSVARAVLDQAQCPLVVVPARRTTAGSQPEPVLAVLTAGT